MEQRFPISFFSLFSKRHVHPEYGAFYYGLHMTSLYPPLSLYVHLPWCIKKCPYCDFNAHTLSGDLPETAYLEQLKRDLAEELKDIHNRPLRSIFLVAAHQA